MKQVSVILNWNPKQRKFYWPDKDSFLNEMCVVFDKETIIEAVFGRQGKTRSNQQNKYLWSVPYKLLAEHTGHTPEDIHSICKYKFNRKEYHLGDEDFVLGGSTTRMTTVEFEEYAENIRRWGATLGVNIPEPNEQILETLKDKLGLTPDVPDRAK